MVFSIKHATPARQRCACAIIGIYENGKLSDAGADIDRASRGQLRTILRRGDIEGKVAQTLLLHNVPGVAAERVLLVGCGQERELDDARYRKVVVAAAARIYETGAADAVSHLVELPLKGRDIYWKVRQGVEIVRDSGYRFERLKTKKNSRRRTFKRMTFNLRGRREIPTGEEAVRDGTAIANGVELAKDLGNLPPNICTPTYLAEQARELSRRHRTLKVTVIDKAAMEKLGMGALLAVARGSHQPPKLILIEYRGGKVNGKPIALVGKGVTFDSGGISIKPAANMDEMKFDMCGAASVLGTLGAAAELKLPLHLVGAIPATENLPGGSATKPADVVTSLSGQTIEILNTDAEGRLILCDAITYTDKHYEPAVLIDIATLTGACVIALGNHATGLFSNHEPLASALLAAGQFTGDQAWRLPLWEEYQSQLDSPFADMANIGGREGGAITAACFLSRFTGKLHWAHLDIAGTAWRTGKQKGATGRPVPLLVQYLLNASATGD
ncbi:MAG: leucyl aminopeptidase [Chromatiales bacterium]